MIDKNNLNIQSFIDAPVIGPVGGQSKILRANRFEHLAEALTHVPNEGQILEFGVRKGGKGSTFKLISDTFPERIIHGFDSFEGLPEDWVMNPGDVARAKSMKAPMPVPPKNGKFWKGWFDETIDEYLKEYPSRHIAFLHIDCDLYSSTKTIFKKLNHLIIKDTIITFDDFYPFGTKPYSNWQEHEWKAFVEWVTDNDRSFEVISRNNHWQATIKVTK